MTGNLFRLFMLAGFGFLALLLLLIGLARNDENLLAPGNFILALVLIGVYLIPSVVALYRDCESRIWIVLLNVLLGWTILGWLAALGWANGGQTRQLPPSGHPPTHPLPTR
jgi:hypothetical protein